MKTRSEFVIRGTETATEPQTRQVWHSWFQAGEKRPYLISFAIGVIMGLVVLGWWLFPIQWTHVPYGLLGEQEKAILLDIASDLNAYNPQSPQVQRLVNEWGEIDVLACAAAELEAKPTRKIQLMALAYRINGQGCIDDSAQ
jgi:hypothetical protein